ncbi:hypothetical protein [Vitreimonas flagellata]|uniref:hypothetical protein n=1 Tax=Vitreimonas flagellata TaxID=2560861 RepID=UPI001074E8DD|nr:hypothetical protein [Vitreimonas flagellata]
MKHTAPTITEHRKTRLIAWARLLLFWVGALMFRDGLGRISERHLLARGFYANLDAVARTINNIIILHAAAKLGMGTGHPPKLRNYASTGFCRRTRVRSITRAGRGAWLRKRLQHRDLLTRFLLIVNALKNVDALVDRAARRFARGLTRLFGIRLMRPPRDSARTLALPEVICADSS